MRGCVGGWRLAGDGSPHLAAAKMAALHTAATERGPPDAVATSCDPPSAPRQARLLPRMASHWFGLRLVHSSFAVRAPKLVNCRATGQALPQRLLVSIGIPHVCHFVAVHRLVAAHRWRIWCAPKHAPLRTKTFSAAQQPIPKRQVCLNDTLKSVTIGRHPQLCDITENFLFKHHSRQHFPVSGQLKLFLIFFCDGSAYVSVLGEV